MVSFINFYFFVRVKHNKYVKKEYGVGYRQPSTYHC